MFKIRKKISKEQLIEARKTVSDLIFKVLTEAVCVREAIKRFPSDIDDRSVQCAWHALVHYEADEKFRLDRDYAQEQDDYLEMIAFILQKGEDIPENIIGSYDKYYDMALIPNSNTFSGWIRSLLRFTI